MNGEKDFIQMPFIVRPGAPSAELVRIGLPKFPALRPHRFIGQDEAAFGHQPLHIAVAQAEAELDPHSMAANLRWEPMTLVWVDCKWSVHAASMPQAVGSGKVGKLT
jgi:hypothetical protein